MEEGEEEIDRKRKERERERTLCDMAGGRVMGQLHQHLPTFRSNRLARLENYCRLWDQLNA
jgi:hypothetical protein